VLLGEFPSFDEPDLHNEGKFKAAKARFTNIKEIKVKDLTRWLEKGPRHSVGLQKHRETEGCFSEADDRYADTEGE